MKMKIMLHFIYKKPSNITIRKMPEEEETAEERRARWMKREAAKAEEGGRKAKNVRCSKCGEEIEEFIEVRGRVFCTDC